jgi:glycosyltransferase involved in cell wall biosynthesis
MTGTAGQGAERRILLIAYHFPPSAAVGGMRMANFARCLSAFGWAPSVLTIRDESIAEVDVERLRGLEGIPIHKARVFTTVEGIYPAVKRRLVRRRRSPSSADAGAGAALARGAVSGESFLRRIRRYILAFLALPDRERGWILPATAAAIRLIRRDRIGWIMTSCPPYSGHLIGLVVKRMTGTRWVADFRDPWMTTGSKRLYPTCALSLRIESWLERKVIENADIVLFNVERLRNAYRERHRHVPRDRFVFIPNAIAPRPLPDPAGVPKYGTFTFCYTGSLYVGRSPEPVWQALALLIRENRIAADAVRFKLIGHCRSINGTPTSVLARKYGLESVVEVHDTIPHADALDIVSRSHLALLLAPDLPFQIPAKVYDYLGAGTRILAIADDGGTADLVRETASGQAFSPGDVEGIAKFIREEIASLQLASERPPVTLDRFDIRRVTQDLAGHLGRVEAMSGVAS